ncbi:uncharacterized protein LOC102365038 [Latimeria chalumnae]|uniref:uncharacterized protein LOC102365038 n=1 Tax=Latimeria chalumnae TaxID=7897 RepID=UPI0003C16CA2|nr:PREDICTED: uncharacterized protein LOC102365038 [Latimeria chalumnae]|eukprot:XP_006013739.1 PREDICTED: uncharacterized protein LOC102365038 [Latimeria chalumnae]
MTTPQRVSDILQKERPAIMQILGENPTAMLEELVTALIVTEQEYLYIESRPNPEDRVRIMIDTIIKKEESQCQTFLDLLKTKHHFRLSVERKPKTQFERLTEEGKIIPLGSDEEFSPIYLLKLKEKILDGVGSCRKCIFQEATAGKEQKVILVVGATGAGKSTLINRMVNYILGVKWEDKHRFKIIAKETNKTPAKSQTSAITAYELGYREGFRVPYNLTIIDTPGFGDTRGIERDNRIIEQIRTFFTAPGSINSIDAVCFVIQASQCCFTPTERYVFDSILSISGKDIAENILVLVTFADGKKVPVLATIEVSDVSCSPDSKGIPVPFKFNNAALFANNEAENSNADFRQMVLGRGRTQHEEVLSSFKQTENQTFTSHKGSPYRTQAAGRDCGKVASKSQCWTGEMEELRKTKQSLEDNKAKMDANKD